MRAMGTIWGKKAGNIVDMDRTGVTSEMQAFVAQAQRQCGVRGDQSNQTAVTAFHG